MRPPAVHHSRRPTARTHARTFLERPRNDGPGLAGVVRLDDAVAKWFPEWTVLSPYATKNMTTLRQVMLMFFPVIPF